MSKPDGKFFKYVGGPSHIEYECCRPYNFEMRGVRYWVEQGERYDVGSTSIGECIGWPSVGSPMEAAYGAHDKVYRNPSLFPGIKRRHADKMMRETGKAHGASMRERWVAWWFVRRFGKKAWNKHRKDSNAFKEMH